MSKKNILRAAVCLLILALALFAAIPIRHAKTDQSDWMAELSDSTPLCELTIPGTHDSGALYSIADVFGKCQTLTVADQLKIGVRFLDIRLQPVDNELCVVHSIADQKTKFVDMMADIAAFLRENPSEFLIVSLKQDASPKRSDIAFAESLESLLCEYTDILNPSAVLPATVGEARGKLHIIARYADAALGLPCYDGWTDDDSFVLNGLYIQDNYRVNSSEEKFFDVVTAFEAAATGEYALVLNYTSCYLTGGFPPIYAGLPTHDIHAWLYESLPLIEDPIGVLLCDFITSDLADLIIGRNFQ